MVTVAASKTHFKISGWKRSAATTRPVMPRLPRIGQREGFSSGKRYRKIIRKSCCAFVLIGFSFSSLQPQVCPKTFSFLLALRSSSREKLSHASPENTNDTYQYSEDTQELLCKRCTFM